MKRFKLAIAGGTFDHFHKGHEALLSKAFEVADKVFVGVTDEKMASKKPFPLSVQSFAARKAGVLKFLSKKRFFCKASVGTLHDVYGPQVLVRDVGAIVVTKDTTRGARAINLARKKTGLMQAKVIICPFVKAEDNKRLSSTNIRLGQVDRSGKVFLKSSSLPRKYMLTKSVTAMLKRPFGKLFVEPDAARKAAAWVGKDVAMVAVVGDATFSSLSKIGIAPDLTIVDGKTLRKATGLPKGFALRATKVSNPPGQITRQLILLIKKATRVLVLGKTASSILVFGEEDLAVIPVILALPLNSVVFYGQPKKGVVAVLVDERKKKNAAKLLSRFTRCLAVNL